MVAVPTMGEAKFSRWSTWSSARYGSRASVGVGAGRTSNAPSGWTSRLPQITKVAQICAFFTSLTSKVSFPPRYTVGRRMAEPLLRLATLRVESTRKNGGACGWNRCAIRTFASSCTIQERGPVLRGGPLYDASDNLRGIHVGGDIARGESIALGYNEFVRKWCGSLVSCLAHCHSLAMVSGPPPAGFQAEVDRGRDPSRGHLGFGSNPVQQVHT